MRDSCLACCRHINTSGPVLGLLACCVFWGMAPASMPLLSSAPALEHVRWLLSAWAGNMILVRCLGKKVRLCLVAFEVSTGC